jgi:hypothetical protein
MTTTHRAPVTTIDFFQILASAWPLGSTAQALANWYLRATRDDWMGRSEDYQRLTHWLSAYWQPVLPPRPSCCPCAMNTHGGGGRGIAWYETPETIAGYISGVEGGYLIPAREARERLVRLEAAYRTNSTRFRPN